MNIALKRTIGLTLLILLVTAAVWTIVYFGNKTVKSQKEIVSANTQQISETQEVAPTSTEVNKLQISVHAGDFLPNPFALPATTTFMEDRDWVVVDNGGATIASGTIPGLLSSYSAFGDVYWYSKLPTSEDGELRIAASDNGPQLIVPVKLQTKTQTVELYFRNPVLSNCGTVEPVKRTIISTGENDLYFYESALRELLKGPSKNEAEKGLVTMIPEGVKIIRVGKNEKGRYIADFTQNLQDPNQIDCFHNIAKNQIQKTLSTVPLPGTTLDGVILIEGEVVED
ncbi:MAG: GerMN domain-containing protein [Patescibacteria group bacterium]|nr:GerMN domain-containing protein [Patescibacteria group bacterium]